MVGAITDLDRMIGEVRRWVDQEVIPVASDMEHRGEFPEVLLEQMKEMGLLDVLIPADYGGLGLDMVTYSALVEEVSRGWMSLGGIMNTHFIVTHLINTSGTDDQKERFLPQMSQGQKRGCLTITEPNAGSDVQAIQTTAKLDGDEYVLNGTKMFVTNGLRGGIFAVLAKTDPSAQPRHRGISCFIVERDATPGFQVSREIHKLGYKGTDTAEVVFNNARVPLGNLLGGFEGRGFQQAMGGLEVGRLNVAARAVGVAQAAFDDAIRYAQQRETFGQPIAEHQAIQMKLAEMATKIEAGRLLARSAAEKKETGDRSDLEAAMAKFFCSEMAQEVALDSMRIHGGYGYTTDMRVERYYRDTPFMIIGEGTNEIQKQIIARALLRKYQAQGR